ncbi:MAG TPA: menaquinone biosynthesis protein [Puia sp.]|nr:menaquinone biosynthesis protein [Puia sp.]
MDRKIRVGAVSYLNTKPLLYGIKNSPVIDEISLITEFPARIADMLLRDEIDIGLVPVAIIPQMKEYHINTSFCIGSDGPVASVGLFSEVPIHDVKTVILDYQSRTSVLLAEILFEKYWKRKPEYVHSDTDFLNQIKGNTAAVIIGDRALQQRKSSAYFYDLGEVWKQMTGLPFVFAAWISNKALDPIWLERFNDANAYGVQNIPLVLEQISESFFDFKQYYTSYLSYRFDEEKKKGLNLFLQMLADKK